MRIDGLDRAGRRSLYRGRRILARRPPQASGDEASQAAPVETSRALVPAGPRLDHAPPPRGPDLAGAGAAFLAQLTAQSADGRRGAARIVAPSEAAALYGTVRDRPDPVHPGWLVSYAC